MFIEKYLQLKTIPSYPIFLTHTKMESSCKLQISGLFAPDCSWWGRRGGGGGGGGGGVTIRDKILYTGTYLLKH